MFYLLRNLSERFRSKKEYLKVKIYYDLYILHDQHVLRVSLQYGTHGSRLWLRPLDRTHGNSYRFIEHVFQSML